MSDSTTMNAVLHTTYGSPDLLEIGTTPRPEPGPDEVLVRVHAASLHKGDWHVVTGTPKAIRLAGFGVFRPSNTVLGMSFAGTVVRAAGSFAVGDAVFGEVVAGAFAEYVAAPLTWVAPMPRGVSFEEAATVSTSGQTAWQAVVEEAEVVSGQRVLVNGASGGVGAFAVQIAKLQGAEVTGVCSTRNVDLVKELGADHIVDYTRQPMTDLDTTYDCIIDLVGNHTPEQVRPRLGEAGKLVTIGAGSDGWAFLRYALRMLLASMRGPHRMWLSSVVPHADKLLAMTPALESGAVSAPITERVDFAGVPALVARLGTGRARGKMVIHVHEATAVPHPLVEMVHAAN